MNSCNYSTWALPVTPSVEGGSSRAARPACAFPRLSAPAVRLRRLSVLFLLLSLPVRAAGGEEAPISMTNHRVTARLEAGTNVLAVRFITGNSSSILALGGPGEFAAEEERLARRRKEDALNVFPERFEDRLIFPVEVQATIMADRGLTLSGTDADLLAGALAGLEAMPGRQMALEGRLTDTLNRRFDEPVAIKLSKYRYPWEDAHLDAIVWTTPHPEETPLRGSLEVRLLDGDGAELARHAIEDLSPSGWFFSVGFPDALRGSAASLEVIWLDGEREVGRARAPFHVQAPTGIATSGRVPLRLLNEAGARVARAPMTLGVPFPRGALSDPAQVRLVDEFGVEQPLQTRVSGRWSRFGPVKWLLCDFTADLDGTGREWFLEYGPDVRRAQYADLPVSATGAGVPDLDANRLRVRNGALYHDATGQGAYERVMSADALLGAYVRHENGRRYVVAPDARHEIEELGSEKILVRRTGWYVEPESGERFCQYVTRLVFHRASPVLRIYHTWIYTGDSNRDRIADMGWVFAPGGAVSEAAILPAFDAPWLETGSLVQFDYGHYLLPETGEERVGRAPGVAALRVGNTRVLFGAKDFWQNFPSEVAFEEEGLAFYNWPRRNPPARFERPVPVREAFRLRFAHEGEVLDLRMPDEYAERDIWFSATRGNVSENHYIQGRPETVNAQGVARTEELFLYFAPAEETAGEAVRVIRGLNDETLRAVADPAWMTGSGAWGLIHPVDTDRFAEEERLYAVAVEAPARWVERLGVYGMWVHGDYPTWNINLSSRFVNNYRAYRKTHHAFPYRAIPFIRTGEPRFLKLAENAARQLADATFCHYATADVNAGVGPEHNRQQGWWKRSMFPWAGGPGPWNRAYTVDSDYLWDVYYLTGFGRVRDVALLFGELTKQDYRSLPATRHSQSPLKSYLDMYQATFDPWFLDAAHEIARLHMRAFGGDHEIDPLTSTPAIHTAGYDHWRMADQAFYGFTGSDAYRSIALNSAVAHSNPRAAVISAGAGEDGGAEARHAVYAWRYTGDPFYLRRAASALDYLRYDTYEGDIEYFRGVSHGSHGGAPLSVARTVPMAMAALVEAGSMPDPVHRAVWIRPERGGDAFPPVLIQHAGGPLVFSLDARGGGVTRAGIRYRVTGPDGVLRECEGETSAENIVLDAPPGTIRIEIFGDLLLFLPLAMPDVPEVLFFEPDGAWSRTRGGGLGYWFRVPEGMREFRVRYATPAGGRQPVHRASVWDPEGRRVWDRSFHNDDLPVEAVISVPEGMDGRLWRATGGNAELDSRIPPYFSLSRTKWFKPEEVWRRVHPVRRE